MLLYSRPVDVQTYSPTVSKARITENRRTARRLVFVFFGKPTSEEHQKKDGKRPKPVKPPKPKIKKQKPEREDDKEKQEENEPRTEGPIR
jgi:hypothetical protein